ncbi:MAG: hypothetical protein LIO94_03425 [Clostridiales bacterium]|nr:hypothetical protein [Clostridiales bacterium]
MSFRKTTIKSEDELSRWLIRMLGENGMLFPDEAIPEQDLERMESAKAEEMAGTACTSDFAETAVQTDFAPDPESVLEQEKPDRLHRFRNWKRVAVVSGFAAAGSAALTGLIVLVCMRHSSGWAGTNHA